ncbi:MAG: hypothetical protein K6A74_10790 [Lachnospiraceae bacterium]|nr:hypothetical protein [Lachnospiraceae bacterium]
MSAESNTILKDTVIPIHSYTEERRLNDEIFSLKMECRSKLSLINHYREEFKKLRQQYSERFHQSPEDLQKYLEEFQQYEDELQQFEEETLKKFKPLIKERENRLKMLQSNS